MIDYKKLTKEQKQEIYDDWYGKWRNHDCKLSPDSGCTFCDRFDDLCIKLEMKCPVRFI